MFDGALALVHRAMKAMFEDGFVNFTQLRGGKIVFDTDDSLRAELEAFADAAEGIAPYPITPEQILATVGAFEATVNALQDRGQDQN